MELKWKTLLDTPEHPLGYDPLHEISEALGYHEHRNNPIGIFDQLSAEDWIPDDDSPLFRPVTGYELFIMNRYRNRDPNE